MKLSAVLLALTLATPALLAADAPTKSDQPTPLRVYIHGGGWNGGDPPVGLFYSTPPNLGQAEKDPTHTANFGLKLKEHCAAHQVPCDLVYPEPPNVKHATDSHYIKAYLRPELRLTSPLDYQVVQRYSPGKGLVRITGELAKELPAADAVIEVRLLSERQNTPWLRVGGSVTGRTLKGKVEAPAGGWWKLEVRVSQAGKEVAHGSVAHVGIGEVFVIAGQSNSANHGEEKQTTKTRRVTSFDGQAWRIADDPQLGASGGGGSFVPAFADTVVEKENVPVGIIACGIGATSVREWLPKGATFPNPPTLVSRVEQLPDGQWVSKGAAYEAFKARMKSVGPQGFRAVLWHQGESDANQQDTTRTLSGKLYRESLEKLIRDSRRDIGWPAPWFVAQASYHVPGDEGSDDIRAAQASLWRDGLAHEGPDSDALKGKLRERDGKGVHFSGEGLRVHGAKWAEKVLPWLAKQ